MTTEEIEQLAFKGKQLTGYIELPEMCLYQAYSFLYSRYKQHLIDRETAQAEKNQILEAYRNFRSARENYMSVYKTHQSNLIKGQKLLNQLEHEVNETAALEVSLNLIATLTNDLSLPKRVIKRIYDKIQ